MKYLYLLILTFCALFFSFNCKSPSGPDEGPAEPDTTSQNFSFETYEFGDGFESSELNDVWIFDDNNIWAVGFLSSKDTVVEGKDIYNPNIIRWNGSEWKLLPYSGTSDGVYGIWAQDSSNVFFTSGLVTKYESGKFIEYDFSKLKWYNGQSIHKLWGSSNSNVWGVGPWGTIVHFDGSKWSKIDFDRQWYFTAISGNSRTGKAYAAAYNGSNVRIIVELENSTANIIYTSPQSSSLKTFGIKFLDDYLYMAGSDFSCTLIWRYNILNEQIDSLHVLPPTTGIFKTTGGKENDLYFWGSDYGVGKMLHYNGKRYKLFNLPKASLTTGSAYTEGNISVFVGFTDNKGYATVVKRIE